jgi:hypothetical protein
MVCAALNDLARLGIQSHPDPWLVPLLPDEAPHLIGFGFQPLDDHISAGSPGRSTSR